MLTKWTEEYPLATWRLLNTGSVDGATNMATDEAILTAVTEGRSPPTLRFFAWEPPCLSIGYNQAIDEVDITESQRAGVDVVRRPTGGRAILHTDELTYSIVALQSEPRVTGGVVESYRRLSAGLVRGLRLLGVDVAQAGAGRGTAAPTGQDADVSAACFDAPSAYEVTAGGKKLVGSAQVRRKEAVLQHGSLPLQGDITRICGYLVVPSEERRQALRQELRARATSLELVLGRVVPFAQVVEALVRGFSEALNLHLEPGELSGHELSLVQRFRREKYTAETWNFRK
jgi:lipoate-protein ligase A